MQNKLDEIHSDIKELRNDIKGLEQGQIKLIEQSARHNVILEQHEQRSTTLEKMHDQQRQEMDLRIKPIEQHVHSVDVALKIALALAGVAGFVLTILEILSLLKK